MVQGMESFTLHQGGVFMLELPYEHTSIVQRPVYHTQNRPGTYRPKRGACWHMSAVTYCYYSYFYSDHSLYLQDTHWIRQRYLDAFRMLNATEQARALAKAR